MTTPGGAQSQGRTYGYVRDETELGIRRQIKELQAHGVSEADIIGDIASLSEPLPGLAKLIVKLRDGDSLHVHSLDTIGRRSLDERLVQLTDLGVAVYEDGELLPAEEILRRRPVPHRTSVLSERRRHPR